jgi:hypothetical protein
MIVEIAYAIQSATTVSLLRSRHRRGGPKHEGPGSVFLDGASWVEAVVTVLFYRPLEIRNQRLKTRSASCIL